MPDKNLGAQRPFEVHALKPVQAVYGSPDQRPHLAPVEVQAVKSIEFQAVMPVRAPAIARPRAARELLGISQSTLRRLVIAGKLRQVHLGPRARGFLISELNDYLAAKPD